jgi:hypothetical protein
MRSRSNFGWLSHPADPPSTSWKSYRFASIVASTSSTSVHTPDGPPRFVASTLRLELRPNTSSSSHPPEPCPGTEGDQCVASTVQWNTCGSHPPGLPRRIHRSVTVRTPGRTVEVASIVAVREAHSRRPPGRIHQSPARSHPPESCTPSTASRGRIPRLGRIHQSCTHAETAARSRSSVHMLTCRAVAPTRSRWQPCLWLHVHVQSHPPLHTR